MATNKSKSTRAVAGRRQDTVLPQPVHRRIQNFLLIWLDANLDETKEDSKKSLQQLRRIVASISTFTDAKKCIDFLSEIKTEKVFIIVSGELVQLIVPDIEASPPIYTIYVLSDNEEFCKSWAKKFKKIKGVYTNIETICKELAQDLEVCDRDTVTISFNGIDPLFIYTRLLKEALLQIEDDDQKSIKELVEFCRLGGDIDEGQIQKVEREYRSHTPIWWYTYDSFMYSMLNRGLRGMDTDIILKMGFFIRHLHNHIQDLYEEQQFSSPKMKGLFTIYRGQGLALENFYKLKKTKGSLMSFNNFLSTSWDRKVSFQFARTAAFREDSVGILFIIAVDPQICRKSAIPFADVKEVGFYKDTEAELLFTSHTIFRIENIQHLQDENADRLWEVNLTLVGSDDHELNSLVSNIRDDCNRLTGWSRLGYIFIKIGEPAKAEHLYRILLENATTDEDRAHCYHWLGWVYDDLGDYSKAISYYEKYLEYQQKILAPNDPELANSYNNIGNVHRNMGKYSEALSSYERSLEIQKKALPPNHLDLATSYNNIGAVYDEMGEHSKALSSYERSLAIQKIALPPSHPDLATSYNNIGAAYDQMGQCSKALSSYEQSLEIQKIALPPNHPDLATSYNNIGMVYDSMHEYLKALSSYEQSLEIRKIALSPNHPELATSYNNIGAVYDGMGEYSKALSSYERSLEIRKIALSPNHPELATSYNNIGAVYDGMGEYSKALSSYEQSLKIRKIALPPNHPDLGASYNNIGNVYKNMGEYSEALSNYKKAQKIWITSFPPEHQHIVHIERNIESVKKKMKIIFCTLL